MNLELPVGLKGHRRMRKEEEISYTSFDLKYVGINVIIPPCLGGYKSSVPFREDLIDWIGFISMIRSQYVTMLLSFEAVKMILSYIFN